MRRERRVLLLFKRPAARCVFFRLAAAFPVNPALQRHLSRLKGSRQCRNVADIELIDQLEPGFECCR